MNHEVRTQFEEQIERWHLGNGLVPALESIEELLECDEVLPEKYCDLLGIAAGSTYREAAREFVSRDVHVLDLHGYPVCHAVEVAEETLERAQNAGVSFVKLIHGAPDVRHQTQAQYGRRGGIKWALRGCLSRGDWGRWVYPRRSSRHHIEDGAMTLAMRHSTGTSTSVPV